MANFPGLVLTDDGRTLQAKAQIGATLTITRVGIGDGTSSSPESMVDLQNERLSLSIQDFELVGDGTSRIRVIMTNQDVSNGFFVRELGVFAEDPDTQEDKLYSYTTAGEQPDFLPAGGGATVVENVFDIYTVVGNAQNVTAVINDFITIATKQDIDEIRPYLVPEGGLTNQLMRKVSNEDGDTEWFDPEEGIGIKVQSIEERRIAVANQRTFTLAIVTTRGMAVYVNGERQARNRYTVLGDTQMRFANELSAGDEVLFIQNEEVGEIEISRVSLTGDSLIFPGTSNEYIITDYDSFAEYTVTASRGDVSRVDETITLVLDAGEPDGNLDLNIARGNAAVTYSIAVGAPLVRQPDLTAPGQGDTDVELTPTLQSTAFRTSPDDFDTHLNSDWQIASDAGFTTIVWESLANTTDLTSIVVDDPLPRDTLLYARVLHRGDSLGASEYSATVSFTTTDQFIVQPTITSPSEGAVDVPEQPVFESSAFATDPAGVDTHAASSWRLRNNLGTVVWESLLDTSNLLSITPPAGVLDEGENTYTIEVRHHGDNLPASEWSATVSFVTASQFVPDEPGAPFGGGYFVARMYEEDLTTEYALVVSTKADGDPGGTRTWQQAMDFAAGVTSGGFSDWKLPDLDEGRALYWNLKPTTQSNNTSYGASNRIIPPTSNYTSSNPSQTAITAFQDGGAEAFIASTHWTETESGSSAYRVNFFNGNDVLNLKTTNFYVRAVRRVYL